MLQSSRLGLWGKRVAANSRWERCVLQNVVAGETWGNAAASNGTATFFSRAERTEMAEDQEIS